MHWEPLHHAANFSLRRAGRYLAADLTGDQTVLSTSSRNGGQTDRVRYLANHQSCEAAKHLDLHSAIVGLGAEAYHDSVCGEMALPPGAVALMGTAANMNYAAVTTHEDQGLEVTAVVTAGVQGNAVCAGDTANWREGEAGWEKVGGTINTMLLINRPLTEAALARAVVTMTEGKTAALQRHAVRSLYSGDPATGTGTDQFAIAAPRGNSGSLRLTSSGQHVKLGELIGRATRDATLEALRWQNGMEPSYGRSIFAALERFGLREESFFDDIEPWLVESDLELMRQNRKAVFFEPLVGAAAYAMAAVLDRVRYGTLPASAAQTALQQQAAVLAASLAAQLHRWEDFRIQLTDTDPVRLVLHAIAIGWAAKWSS